MEAIDNKKIETPVQQAGVLFARAMARKENGSSRGCDPRRQFKSNEAITTQRTSHGATPGPENPSKTHHIVLGLAFQRRNVVAKSVLPNLGRKDGSCPFDRENQ